MSKGSGGAARLVLVPTELELRQLEALGGLPPSLGTPALCGFGPVAAAARTAELLARLAPRHVFLVGIAGTLAPARVPLGSALSFASVVLDGVGAGSGTSFLPPSRLGFPQWGRPGAADAIEERLELAERGEGELLTVTAASASFAEAEERRRRHPAALGEDMEGFGAALACRLAGIPLTIVRGFSNAAGDRSREHWDVRGALAAARTLLMERAASAGVTR